MSKKEKKVKVKGQGFFHKFTSELSKVKWPEGKEVLKYSIATIFFVIIFALFFEGLNLFEAFIKGLFK